MPQSRREFLAATSAVAAGTILGTRSSTLPAKPTAR